MNYKTELIERVARRQGITESLAKQNVDAVIEEMCDCCVDGGITLKGKFSLKKILRKGRKGIIGGKSYESKDRYTLKITVSEELAKALNK